MRIRRFEAKDSSSALALIKMEMGEDAVILASKNIADRNGGTMVEVVAAIDYDIDNITVPPPEEQQPGHFSQPPGHTYNLHSVNEPDSSAPTESQAAPQKAIAQMATTKKHTAIHSEARDLRLRFANLLGNPKGKTEKKYKAPPPQKGNVPKSKKRTPPDPAEVAIWREQLINRIQYSQPDQPLLNGTPATIALVGATGVGKTTTAAKLAAWYSLRQGRRVCLLSMDCYRIGATDQLRTYAKIMRLPCEVVLRKADLAKAIERHRDKLIIIDTAGKSPYDDQHIPELQEWFAPFDEITPHLVISAATKKEDIHNVLNTYKPLNISSMVLTKLDETRAYAALCQQIASAALPVSYLCTGQRVPEDFMIASKDFLDALFKKGWPAAASHMEC